MGNFEHAGSAVLHLRLTAFGGAVAVLCTAGLAPVTAAVLVLFAAVVFTKL
jgi:hypothetical protein